MAAAKNRALSLSFAVLAAAVLGLSVSAQNIKIETDEDALFGDEDAGVEIVASEESGKAVKTFLKTESVRIGGTFSGALDSSWGWTDPWNDGFDPLGPQKRALSPTADAKIFFDARPDEESRYYGSMKASWPYKDQSDFQLFELFADFSWRDALYFRFGKHTVKWGVGYFWSPADVINLGAIDPTDPAAQREGPISLRLHVPVPNTQNNLWAYAVLPNVSDAEEAGDVRPDDIAAAVKYEFLVGGYEIGAGAFYQKDTAPKAVLTATGALRKLNMFGEAVFGWGSDKTWATGISSSEQRDDGLYVSATAGFSYSDSANDFTAYFQYFFNGDGYADEERKDLIDLANDGLDAPGAGAAADELSSYFKGLIYQSGLHYAGAYLSKTDAGVSDLTLSILAIANLSDLSGFVQPAASYSFFDGLSLALSPTFVWSADLLWGAGDDAEYVVTAGGASITLSLKATLGSGSF